MRFPVTPRRGVAFREVARRHGDFAIVAVAAVAESSGAVQFGVAGASAKPVVREIASGHDTSAAVHAVASELEGYEDLHASAAMRRDLLRRLGPLVIEEAIRCAA